jgi:hypothetical protein
VIIANGQQVALRPSPVIAILLAVDGGYMGWIFIQIRPPNSKVVAVRINPFPQAFA